MTISQDYLLQQKHFEQFVQAFLKDHEQPQQKDIDSLISEIKTMEKYAVDGNRFYLLFDHSKFYPIYISSNWEEASGFSPEYVLNQGLFFFFNRIHWKQLMLPFKLNTWGPKFQAICGPQVSIKQNERWIGGIKFKDKWKNWRTGILKQKILAATKKNKALLSFVEVEEITSIYKADFVWYRPTCWVNGKKITRTYFSNGAKKEYPDILSAREIEILQLAAQKKSNHEIGEQLEISKNTVERHRKNMIARVGVTDMTALMQIAQMLKLI